MTDKRRLQIFLHEHDGRNADCRYSTMKCDVSNTRIHRMPQIHVIQHEKLCCRADKTGGMHTLKCHPL